MGWSHPEIPLEDLLKLIKGFIDIMILGSGYQSSGSIATWDSHNIQKCIQWGIFYENGIRHLSSATLMKGRDLIMRLLIQTLPLRDVHFTALLTATSLTCGELVGKESTLLEMQSQDGTSLVSKEQLAEFELWNKWRSRGLSYLLDERTIKLVSGAKLIFSSPEVQWIQVFERLDTSNGDELLEIIELCLLGYISSSWNHLIEHVMSVSYDICSKSINYHEMFNLLQERSQFPHSKEETRNSKENDILEYLAVLMRSQSHAFWKLSPILPAIAIPIWCCSCTREVKEHEDCKLILMKQY
ncbi:hypothetical protein C5167_042855 [Papaver somniferum]|uniref:Uncharacterized protein n=1 Tax=Papaver somniferum TaxID=3469 RepID=A0A4Y7L7L6_PAPSO|nr:hypothetical protein C5167_042855 [Papaver somniferum]